MTTSALDDLRYAIDPVAWASEALHLTLDPWQAQAARSTAARSLWNCSRQAGKSTTAAILSLHMALYVSKSLSLVVSRTERQSKEIIQRVKELLCQLAEHPALAED